MRFVDDVTEWLDQLLIEEFHAAGIFLEEEVKAANKATEHTCRLLGLAYDPSKALHWEQHMLYPKQPEQPRMPFGPGQIIKAIGRVAGGSVGFLFR